jgi:NAD(P)-dependent dehydrogenase (short-subunit alcohol dehydrogenase family)
MMRFRGKTVLITGAAGALGSDLSLALAAEGAARLLLVDRAEEPLRALCAKIGPAAQAVACDVASAESMRRAWAGFDLSSGLDLLVAAAGTIGSGTSLLEISGDEFDQMLAINVQGMLLAVQLSLPALRLRKGSVVTYGSTGGLTGSRALGAYSATKGAVVLMTRSLALSLAEEGIRVNAVCPGSIESPMLERNFAAAGEDAERRREIYLGQHPLQRFGTPREVSEAVMYLASDAASYSTGVCLPVDGGRLA